MDGKRIRFGLIGGGLMGREFATALARWCQIQGLEAQPELVAVCSGHETSLAWFRENLPNLRLATTRYEDLLADSGIDAIYCSVPHHLHEAMYVAVIESGKHLLGEKPFGIDLEANRRILETSSRHPKVVVRCVSQFPFFPGAQRICRQARTEGFGQILEVEAGLLHSSDLNPGKPINWKRIQAFNGAYGCMGDLGLHVLHLPLRLGWYPRNVRAFLSDIVHERPDAAGGMAPCDTWDNAVLFCEVHANGSQFPMILKTQRIAPGEGNTWYLSIKGTRSSIRFSTKFPKTLETLVYDSNGPQAWQQEDLGSQSVYKTITGGIFEVGFADAFQQMVAAFCHQVVAGNQAQLPFGCATLEETRMHHEILTAALASHARSQVVPLPPA